MNAVLRQIKKKFFDIEIAAGTDEIILQI